MTYPLKVRKHEESKKKYYSEREQKDFYKREGKFNLKKTPDYTNEQLRQGLSYPRRLHKRGELIVYKNKLGKVKKVTSEGVHIQEYVKDKKSGLITEKKGRTFIKEKDYEKYAHPYFTGVNLGFPSLWFAPISSEE